MMFPDLCRTDRSSSKPVPRSLQCDMDGGAKDAQLRHVPGTGYFDMLLDPKREVAIVVEAGIVDLVRDCIKSPREELARIITPQRYDSGYGFALADSPVLDRFLRKLGGRGLVGQLVEHFLSLLQWLA